MNNIKANIKKALLFVGFIMIFIYSINSFIYIVKWFRLKSDKEIEYAILQDKKEEMDKEIALLKIKVMGLREKTLNKETLEIQAKSILNMYKKDEVILYD
jgi:hypothetical protein